MSHAPLIRLWPSVQAFADDIRVPRTRAKGMLWRQTVPSEYWDDMIDAATARGFGQAVTYEILVKSTLPRGSRHSRRPRPESQEQAA